MANLHLITDLAYADHPRCRIDLVLPDDDQQRPLVACVHGGWWQRGRRGDLLPWAIALAERGIPAAVIGYRLLNDGATNGKQIVDDIRTGLPVAVEEASIYGADTKSAWLLGSGAGGISALNAAIGPGGESLPIGIYGVAMCGAPGGLATWDGITPHTAAQLAAYAGDAAAELDPLQSTADDLPPLFLVHGDADEEVPVAAARRLVRHALTGDVEAHCAVLSGAGHHLIEDADSRAARSCLDRLVPWFTGDE